ncbi:MAG: VCBS repeat-containing protein, partial [Candidatus Acidiferrales bacterium]
MNFRFHRIWMIVVCAAATTMALCSIGAARTSSNAVLQKTGTSGGVHFEDVTRAAGIHFVHNNGAFGKKWLPETMGPGVAFIDYDNDGWQDILLVNGMDWPGHAHKHSTMALYHNNHDGTFTDVTKKAG